MAYLRHSETFLAKMRRQEWALHLECVSLMKYLSIHFSPHIEPPGMSAPGVAPPPGMQANAQQPGRPGGFPPNFQPPANMPNINFNAPVIRLGTTGPSKPQTPLSTDPGRREANTEPRSTRLGLGAGLGMDSQRQAIRESMMQLVPPTKEEIARTIFIGGITEGSGGDNGIERILQCAGNLRRWTRAMDADNKACRFGFAEYEDPESLATAIEVLRDVEVPVKQQISNKTKGEESEDSKPESSKLLVSNGMFVAVHARYILMWLTTDNCR